RNPLADPYLLGAAAGAGLTVTLAVVFTRGGGLTVPAAAFAGAVGGVLLSYTLGRTAGRGGGTATLTLAGVAVSSFLTALQAFVQQLKVDELQRIYAWILGGVGGGWDQLRMIAPYAVLSSAVLLLHGRLLDVLSVGDEEATSLGLHAGRTRVAVLLAASLATASAVAVSGLIGFVGTVVPHAVRRLAGWSYRTVLPLSLLGGAAFLVLADLVARLALAPAELPAGVEVRGLSVRLGGRPVLTDVGLSAPSGGWLAIIGPNGAGKSTLLKAIAGLIGRTGEVRVAGTPVDRLRHRQRARLIAYAPQSPALPPDMTVYEYALLGRTPYIPYLGRESALDKEVTESVLERLGLTGFASRPLGELSGGERQRVVLARALAQQAPVLLLAEPTTALDLGHQQQVLELIDRLRVTDRLTVVTTLHDLSLAGQYADSLVLLAGGRAVAAGPPGRVL